MNKLIQATHFAAGKHRNQRRKDHEQSPYINHPLALANVLANEAGIDDENAIIAALLHDTIEDTETTEEEISTLFGPAVLGIVLEVSDDKSLPKQVRKQLQIDHAAHLSHGARLVKLADKICNLRDVANDSPADWPLTRRIEYFEWAKAVIDNIRDTHAGLEALFDEAYGKKPVG